MKEIEILYEGHWEMNSESGKQSAWGYRKKETRKQENNNKKLFES